jgi:hypothetical protein
MGGAVQFACAHHSTAPMRRVWGRAEDSAPYNENCRDSNESSTNRRCCTEGILNYSNPVRIRTGRGVDSSVVSSLPSDDCKPANNSFTTTQLRNRIPRIDLSSRLGSKALLILSFLCAAFPSSCSSGLKPFQRGNSWRSCNLLCVPCPEVLGPTTHKHPKPRQPSYPSLPARVPLHNHRIQKCHGIDDMEGGRSSFPSAAVSDKKKSFLSDESPEILTATHNGHFGSTDWSMNEEEFQQRSEDIDDLPFDFVPVLKPTADRERSATAAAAAVAAAAANFGRLKLSDRGVDEETSLGMMESNFEPLELECAWRCIPHPLKVARGGEDVHMICRSVRPSRLAWPDMPYYIRCL